MKDPGTPAGLPKHAVMLGLCFAATFATAPAKAQSLASESDNWVPVSIKALREDAWRRSSPHAFAHVRLDMNGDGVKDEAMLVVDRVRHRSALKVCLASNARGVSADCQILAEDEDEGGYEIMGLEVRAPGCHRYNELNEGSDTGGQVCSKAEALDYFRFGSAGSFFLYDKNTRHFSRYWDSD